MTLPLEKELFGVALQSAHPARLLFDQAPPPVRSDASSSRAPAGKIRDASHLTLGDGSQPLGKDCDYAWSAALPAVPVQHNRGAAAAPPPQPTRFVPSAQSRPA